MFYFWLARELGMTVGQLLSEMSSLELAEWKVYFKVLKDDKKDSNTRASMLADLAGRRGRRAL